MKLVVVTTDYSPVWIATLFYWPSNWFI